MIKRCNKCFKHWFLYLGQFDEFFSCQTSFSWENYLPVGTFLLFFLTGILVEGLFRANRCLDYWNKYRKGFVWEGQKGGSTGFWRGGLVPRIRGNLWNQGFLMQKYKKKIFWASSGQIFLLSWIEQLDLILKPNMNNYSS